MNDEYTYVITQNGEFAAGYKHCPIAGLAPSYLFTTLRILRVTRGAAEWKIGPKVCRIRKGDVIVVNNVEPRKFLRVDDEDLFGCEIFAFLPTIFSNAPNCLRLFYDRSADFNPVMTPDMPFACETNTLLDMLVKNFEDAVTPESASLAIGLITSIVSMLIKNAEHNFPGTLGSTEHDSRLAVEIIVRSVQYINENISSEFGVSELAEKMNLSRGYFSKVFKKYTGTSPVDYINRCRVTNAINLIGHDRMNILDAAMASGFGSASGFYKTFRAVCGCSPKEYCVKFLTNRQK